MANIINGTDTGSGGLITTGDSSDELQLQTAETARVTLTNTAVVVNEDGNDVDFRVEGDTDANLLFVDAGNDKIGIGTSSPSQKMDVTVDTGTEGSGLAVTNLQAGGYGSGVTFYSVRADTSAKVAAGAIRMFGEAAWNSDATVDSNMRFYTVQDNTFAERMRITSGGDLNFNSGYGSVATAYGCRAWVNFNGTGTVAIRASGNVSSITDNGTGLYTINFSSAMPDGNYAPAGLARDGSNANGQISFRYNVAPATGSLAVETIFASLFNDADYASIIVIR